MADTSLVATPVASSRTTTLRRTLIVVGAVLLLLSVVEFGRSGRGDIATDAWALDYDINLIAARRLVDHEDIYSRRGSVETGRTLVAPYMRHAYTDPFTSYIGTPVVALTHVPFLALDHDDGTRTFRALNLIMMIAAIVLAAWALAPAARLPAALFGTAALFWTFPTVKSIAMGQANGLVMLALALALWAVARERWGLVGVALGVAAVLKLSPVLLLVYLFVRGRRRPMWTGIATALGLVGAAAIVGRPGQIFDWAFDVAPSVSKGTISGYNQSIVGAFARLSGSTVDFMVRSVPGSWYLVAYAVWAVALFALWRMRRGRPFDGLELAIVLLVVLVAGPLTWDHYMTWALLPLTLCCDMTRWQRLRPGDRLVVGGGLVLAAWLFHRGIQIPLPATVRADWSSRLLTTRHVVGAITLMGATWWLLARAPVDDHATTECPDEPGATAVGTARPVVAAGVHPGS
jgi:alpha-1,2-mannosyltransferase